jgi:hypothetical protein
MATGAGCFRINSMRLARMLITNFLDVLNQKVSK